MIRPVAIVVLGMHRSGTSALAGCLNLLGVPLGAPLLPAGYDNQRGYFEHEEVVRIHDELLGSFGASALDLRRLPADWVSHAAARTAQERLRELLHRDFSGKPLWAVKDPRLCILAPLWEPVLRDMDVEPRYVLMLRSPWEVAQSLSVRDGLGIWESLDNWSDYTAAAERACRDSRRAVTTFDRILAHPEAELSFLAAALDVEWPRAVDDAVRGEVRAFLDPSLRHWVAAATAQEVDYELVNAVENLQSLVAALRESVSSGLAAQIDAAHSALATRLASRSAFSSRINAVEDEYRLRWLKADAPGRMEPGQRLFFDAALIHEGERPLSKRGLSISYRWIDATELSHVVVAEGVRTPITKVLFPGETYETPIAVLAPPEAGQYLLQLDVVREEVTWFSEQGCAPAMRSVEVQSSIV